MTDSVEKDGHEIISETNYDLITFDAVPDPGFKSARLSKVESAMRPIDSMTITELKSASSSLKSAKVPAFESRIRMIDKEIERRQSIDLTTEVNNLRTTLDMVKKAYSLSKVEDVDRVLEQAKTCLVETRERVAVIEKTQKEYLENCSLTIEKEFNGKRILFVHFPIDYDSKDQYPFHDLKITKDASIKKIIELLNYDLIFIGHEHKDFSIDNKLYDVGSSGCRKDNNTRYTILDTDTFNVETKILEYDRENFEKDLLVNDYPDRNIIAKWFFGIEI